MAPTRYLNTEAIILKTRPVGDFDQHILLYTPHHGKLSALAKGTRRPKSQRRSSLEIGNLCHIQLYHTTTNQKIIVQSLVKETFQNAKQNLSGILTVMTLLEMVDKSVQLEYPFPVHYNLLKQLLCCINKQNTKSDKHLYQRTVTLFILKHLQLFGLINDISKCGNCHQKHWSEGYLLYHSYQIVCAGCRHRIFTSTMATTINYNTISALSNVQKNSALENMKTHDWKEMYRIAQDLLASHLKAPLKTPAFETLTA